MLGFSPLDALPLSTVEAPALAPLTATALEIAVVLPVATIPGLGLTATPLLVAVVLPIATMPEPTPTPTPVAARPFLLLGQIDFASPSALTLYVSDQYVPPEVTALGVPWLPLVASWGPLDELTAEGAPATSEVVFFNTKPVAGKPRLSDLLRSPLNSGAGTYEFANAKLTLYRLDAGDPATTLLNVLYIEEPTAIDERLLSLRMSDAGLVYEDGLIVSTIDKTAFPLAPNASVGKTLPRTFGVLKNVPAIPVVDGGVTAVVGALTAAAVTIPVAETSVLLAAGTVQIDGEQITYTGRSTSSGAGNLTGCTRGVNTTTAAAHNDQARLLQVRTGATAYQFVVAEVPTGFTLKSLTNVRANGQPARTAPTVSLADTTLVAGKTLATIRFPVVTADLFHQLPLGIPEVLTPAALSITGDGTTNINVSRVITPTVGRAEVGTKTKRAITVVINTTGGFTNTNTWSLARYLTAKGPASAVQIGSGRGQSATSVGYNGTVSHTIEYPTDGSETIVFASLVGSGVVITCTFTEATVTYDAIKGSSGASTSGLVIGEVTCDVEGVQDDPAGSISGTPGLLLENPADVSRFILRQLFAVPAADFGTRWAASRTTLEGLPYRWAVLLSQERAEKLSDLRQLITLQARAELFVEAGKWDFVVIPDAPTALLTIDYPREVWSERAAVTSRSPIAEVFTRVKGQAQLDFASGQYGYLAVAEVGPGQRKEESLELPWVQRTAVADALVAFWFQQWARQRWEVDLVGWRNLLTLRKADHVAIDHHPVLAAHGGTTLVFRIIERSYLSGDDNPARIRLRAREGNAGAVTDLMPR